LGLDLVDGALYGAGVVRLGQPGGDGLDVTAQPDGERAQRRQVVIDGGHPRGSLSTTMDDIDARINELIDRTRNLELD